MKNQQLQQQAQALPANLQKTATATLTYLQQLSASTAAAICPKSAAEAINETGQISFAYKHISPEICDAMLIKVLNEAMKIGGAATTPDMLMIMAANIRTNFWMLRISEVIYAISRGMSGKYGKQYGTITYPIVAEYLNAYMEGEREAEVTRRREARDAEIKAEVLTLPGAELYLTAKYTPPEKKEQAEVREQTPEDKAFVALVTFANSFTEKELIRLIQDATTLNWPRVLNRATEILNERKSNSLQSLTTNNNEK